MNILIDGYNLGLERGTGVATYGRNLANALVSSGHNVAICYGKSISGKLPLLSEVLFFEGAIQNRESVVRLLRNYAAGLFASMGRKATVIPITGVVNIDPIRYRFPCGVSFLNSPDFFRLSKISFDAFGAFGNLKAGNFDVVHWTYPIPCRMPKATNIYTIHDLIPLKLPYTTLDNKRRYYNICRKIADVADHIVTVSENSKRDIIDILGVPENKVTNTSQAVSFPSAIAEKSTSVCLSEIEGIFGLQWKNYFLFYGAVEPKKNIGRIIEAYLSSGVNSKLVIIGAPGWQSKQELKNLEIAKGSPRGSSIVYLEYLPLSFLVSLIKGAKALVFPSLYEGFGLPVLEAMKLGTAVITSATSSLPEVTGDAALAVDPLDSVAIAKAIRMIDSDDSLRVELESRGVLRSVFFSEESYTNRLNELYKRLGFN